MHRDRRGADAHHGQEVGGKVDLRTRAGNLSELMDSPACDAAALRRTYAQFAVLNPLISGWHRLYRRRLRPLMLTTRRNSLLDIGAGGGDVARALSRWAARDGFVLEVTAIDSDPRACAFALSRPARGVTVRCAASADLVAEDRQYDFVISNHLLHHLDGDGLRQLLDDSERLARRLVVHNDIARNRLGYVAYKLATRPLPQGSFLHHDGLTSIRRSYQRHELDAVSPPGWEVDTQFPRRLILVHPFGALRPLR